ncbi:MAG TPA: multifunctional oxoglutarate decarboxylase/oxoglutarate dehydrogenase thiamine pyrophosphate-binding subunit/dihydrolipoyllysine-residue succinyltransferase subunit [Thermoanaerobaculia bacterium]|nr:multifunctional oxoglutarate decarboxylase/oxoglutarate dehydrogenase thiamine pyrophosphate-binding subunit/dihydrolipoyllysine-residue succinyltransferase subunit [Thermoanaerobaculia bacterium]
MSASSSFGTNIAFIEELYEKYRMNPSSVSRSWQEFFHDYEPSPGEDLPDEMIEDTPSGGWTAPLPATAPVVKPVNQPAAAPESPPLRSVPAPKEAPAVPEGTTVVPLRGVAAKIAQNMEQSISVPTATSVRNIPVKVLDENRRIINRHLALGGQPKISFTHLVAWAIIKAIEEVPRMNSSFAMIDGQPSRTDRAQINFGVAIDVERKDGTRSLVVPSIKGAEALDFAGFVKSYNDVVRRARNNSLEIADFEGTTISLTNPGTIGTIASVPRLMPSQGAIIATGQIDYPAEYSATDPDVLADLGISKIMTITSTYDHRIIQGAESGAFLAKVHALLLGENDFYDDLFRTLRIPYEPVRWSLDRNRSALSGATTVEIMQKEAGVLQMINAYRVRGHLLADLDPLDYKVGRHPELSPMYYNLTIWDLDREFGCGGLCNRQTAKLRTVLDVLRETYCGKLGPEYMHIQEPIQKQWLRERMEPVRNGAPLDPAIKRRILMKLTDAEVFEKFLHTKYVGHKRFSLEGAEAVIPALDHLLNLAVGDEVAEVVIGMAHRGRLNVLANVLEKSYEKIFNEFEGDIDPTTTQGSGDVKYHLGATGKHEAPDGRQIRLTLASNPSHLEAVDPIVEGMARARQKLSNDRERRKVIPLLIHGDAAFAGQGVVAETLNLSQLKGYRTGGTIHIVINNQIGFTTAPEAARSSVYATDVAKMVQAPIFHVNGDDPEACVRAITLAYQFRQEFRKDVVVDIVCYRRHGHNEGDEPSLTQPRMYKLIRDHRSVRKLYTEALLRKGDLDPQEAEKWLDRFQHNLQEAFDRTRNQAAPPSESKEPLWTDEEVTGFQHEPSALTSVSAEDLDKAGRAAIAIPDGFVIHPKLKPLIARRLAMLEGREPLDWAYGETLAFGTLLIDGYRVRLSGQDSGRGTFSQRHAILFDSATGAGWVPLNTLATNHPHSREQHEILHPQIMNALDTVPATNGDAPVNFAVYDSLLSEYGVLGFEYGYSIVDSNALVMWEAQFGDFVNVAQVIIDQFISSAEEKWGQHSALALLLPHGYEGQGPEHSSARLERFLTLCAEGNMQVINPTTPAQYFHALRRQMTLDPRKPLVIVTPKSLLRHPEATSSLDELTSGRFNEVIDDPAFRDSEKPPRADVERLILTSGKIYYDLAHARPPEERRVAICRLEQYYPWPQAALQSLLERYPNATDIVWVQEEPRNMGAWDFLDEKVIAMLRDGQTLRYLGRPLSASPSTGSHRRHEEQQKALVGAALEMGAGG